MARKEKLLQSRDDLQTAITLYGKISSRKNTEKRMAFLSLSKALEIAVEYAWKWIKRSMEEEGLDPQSPKAAVRDAARVGLIADPQQWMLYINTRNAGVHDYFSVPEKEYVEIARRLEAELDRLLQQ